MRLWIYVIIALLLSFSVSADLTQDLQVNLTFGKVASDLLNDSGATGTGWDAQGGAGWLNSSYCKYNGCLNVSDLTGSMYLNSTLQFPLYNGLTVWLAIFVVAIMGLLIFGVVQGFKSGNLGDFSLGKVIIMGVVVGMIALAIAAVIGIRTMTNVQGIC